MALQSPQPQPRRRSAIGDMLRSRSYYSYSFALTLVLLAGIASTLLMGAGTWPLNFTRGQPITITRPTTPPTTSESALLHVYVLGDVRVPAAYTLPRGSHVRDLIAAAGGAHSTADITRVDANALLTDGQAVYVPALDEVLPLQRGGKLDLNAATADHLRHALALTATVSRQIVAYRAKHGNFTAVSQLLLVPVTRVTYDRIKTSLLSSFSAHAGRALTTMIGSIPLGRRRSASIERHDWTAEYADMPSRCPIPQHMHAASPGQPVARRKGFVEG